MPACRRSVLLLLAMLLASDLFSRSVGSRGWTFMITPLRAADQPAAPAAPAEKIPADPVATAAGPVTGAWADDAKTVRAYKGIPFAAPPVGALRWQPPQPVTPWSQPRACVEFGPWCPQPKPVLGKIEGRQSEDCLYLNIWTAAPAAPTPRPVMVWIHGGGYTTGSGGSSVYDGTHLAAHGVVLVTINYRLGPFGFFAHPLLSKESKNGVSGNYGLLDQIAALQWVKANIAAFGGDPGNVTIFGESAGSASVARLMVIPAARGLFHRAIAESGGPFGGNRHLRQTVRNLPGMESVGAALAKTLNCADAKDPLAALRDLPADKILAAANPAQGLFGKGTKFGPVVDGWLIPDDPGLLWQQGKQAPIPFLTGSNADEGTIFLQQLPIKNQLGYRLILRAYLQEDADKMLELFPVDTPADIPGQLSKVVGVVSFIAPAREMVRCMEAIRQPAYLYHFTRVPTTGQVKSYGAFHSAEIFYVFGNFIRPVKMDATDRALSEYMLAAWVRFAETGNPNPPPPAAEAPGAPAPAAAPLAPPAWPAYTTARDQHLELGDAVRPGAHLYAAACDLVRARMDRVTGLDEPVAEEKPAAPPPAADFPAPDAP